jgi:phosphoglycerol transferase MdoB-like AlkP superfamily enzyme
MSRKAYLKTAGSIFLLLAAFHLLRLVFGWEAVFEGWVVPHWVSVVALVVSGYLAYEGFKLSRS